MISLTNHDSHWGRSEVVIIYPDNITTYHLIAVLVPKKPPGTTSHDEFSLPRRTPGILRVFVFVLKFYHKTPGEFNGFHDWLVVFRPTPLKNDGVRQLRWWNSQLNGKKEVPNHQPDDFTMKKLEFDQSIHGKCGIPQFMDMLMGKVRINRFTDQDFGAKQ